MSRCRWRRYAIATGILLAIGLLTGCSHQSGLAITSTAAPPVTESVLKVILTELGGAKIAVTISRYHLDHHLLTDAPQGVEIYNACLTGVDSAGQVSGVSDYDMALFHVDVSRVRGATGGQGPAPTVTIAAGQQFGTGLAPLIPDPTASSDCTRAALPPRTVPSSGDFAIVVPGIEANRFGNSFWQGEYVYVDPGQATISSCIQDGRPMAVDNCALGGGA